jgi:hypothetical protein
MTNLRAKGMIRAILELATAEHNIPTRNPALSTRTPGTRIVGMLRDGQQVRVNLAGMRVGSVVFQSAVTDAVGTIVRQVSENPPTYLVKLLFSFRGVDEVEVPQERIVAK